MPGGICTWTYRQAPKPAWLHSTFKTGRQSDTSAPVKRENSLALGIFAEGDVRWYQSETWRSLHSNVSPQEYVAQRVTCRLCVGFHEVVIAQLAASRRKFLDSHLKFLLQLSVSACTKSRSDGKWHAQDRVGLGLCLASSNSLGQSLPTAAPSLPAPVPCKCSPCTVFALYPCSALLMPCYLKVRPSTALLLMPMQNHSDLIDR